MNLISLALANLRFRRLTTFFNVLILALGIAMIITLLHVSAQLQQRFEGDLKGIDMVVGAKGSPLQLILSSVFHLDIPTGNITLADAQKLQQNPLVRTAIPVALGDSYQGFRIVGTSHAYIAHYNAAFATGAVWSAPMQAVLGSEVAKKTGLAVGGSFSGTHGLTEGGESHDAPYQITGIMAPTGTVIDRLILTDVASVWQVHETHQHAEMTGSHDSQASEEGESEHAHHEEHDHEAASPAEDNREITALLLSFKTPAAAIKFPRIINQSGGLQAASPAFELARLLKVLGVGSDMLQWFGLLLMAIAALGFFVTLFSAVNERQYDLALLRSLGASRRHLFGLVLTEGVLLGLLSIVSGLLMGHGAAYAMAAWIEHTRHMMLVPVGFHPYEWYVVLAALLISALAACIPAIMAYRVNVPVILSRG